MSNDSARVRDPSGPALEVDELRKLFGGTLALESVSIQLQQGSILGVVGPNGSGKTTLLRCISGFLKPDSGRVRLFGRLVTGWEPQRLFGQGVAQTFQRVALAEGMSAAENILLGVDGSTIARPRRLLVDLLGRRVGFQGVNMLEFQHALELTRLEDYVSVVVGELPLGLRRRVEMARAIMARPRVLLLDEPMSGLDRSEAKEMVATVLQVQRELGLAIIVVEHDMKVVRAMCDDVAVLSSGRVLAQGPAAVVLADPRVRSAYLGRQAD